MYKGELYAEFGYLRESSDFKYNMYENMKYGKYCKSGMAKIEEDLNKMTCVEVGNIKTNKDSYGDNQESPYECRIHDGENNVVDDFMSACKYFYTDADGNDQLLQTEYCECSLMEEKDPSEPDDDGSDLPRFYDQIENNIYPIPR